SLTSHQEYADTPRRPSAQASKRKRRGTNHLSPVITGNVDAAERQSGGGNLLLPGALQRTSGQGLDGLCHRSPYGRPEFQAHAGLDRENRSGGIRTDTAMNAATTKDTDQEKSLLRTFWDVFSFAEIRIAMTLVYR